MVHNPLSPRKACFKKHIAAQEPFKHQCLEGFSFLMICQKTHRKSLFSYPIGVPMGNQL